MGKIAVGGVYILGRVWYNSTLSPKGGVVILKMRAQIKKILFYSDS